MPDFSHVTAIVLAAGQGTRMGSDLAKVLHRIGGRPMIAHVLGTCRQLGIGQRLVVVGYQREAVTAALDDPAAEAVIQEDQLGTGHAVGVCRESVRGSVVLVLCGDAPLVPPALLQEVLERQQDSGADCVAVAADMDDPSGYGRMITGPDGALQAIVEHKDASPEQRQVRLVNSGLYAFAADGLFERLQRIRNDNAQGEYYLPDVIRLLVEDGRRVELVVTDDSTAVFGVNTPEDLAAADMLYAQRTARS